MLYEVITATSGDIFIGESGSGKTTLGMALLRLIDSRGEIRNNFV